MSKKKHIASQTELPSVAGGFQLAISNQQSPVSNGQGKSEKEKGKSGEEWQSPVREYVPTGSRTAWRVEQFPWLQAELAGGFKVEDLPVLHDLLNDPANARSWLIVRRLFGIMPKLTPLGGDMDDCRVWSRFELADKLGITEKQLMDELAAVRSAWGRIAEQREGRRQGTGDRGQESGGRSQEALTSDSRPLTPDPRPLIEDEDTVLRRYGFTPDRFNKAGRPVVENLAEKAWFVSHISAWAKLLGDSKTAGAARQALNNELRLRRAEEESWELEAQRTPEDAEKRKAHDKNRMTIAERIQNLEEAYRASLAQLQDLAPGFGVTASAMAATGAIGEIIKGMQDWEARGDMALLDGIYSQYGIRALLRTSTQVPTPGYRVGKVAYLLQSMEWIWDREGKTNFAPHEIAMLDVTGKQLIREYKEKHGMHVPDLSLNGAQGEYEDVLAEE